MIRNQQALPLLLLILGCTGTVIDPELVDPEPGLPHPGPTSNGPLPPEVVDPGMVELLAAPPTGWTELDLSFKVQNWTDAPLEDRFTSRNGEYRTEVHAGESRVEMRWQGWPDISKEHMWRGEVFIENGSTRTAIMQVKSNEDGEPVYIQIFNSNGDLRNNGDDTSIASGMYGKWFTLTVTFNPPTGLGLVWINDKLVKTRQYRTGTRGWYFKNGTYNNGLPEGGQSAVRFRDIHIYRNDGSPAGGGGGSGGGTAPDPAPSGDSVVLEAESLAVVHSGTGTSIQADPDASGGQWLSLDAENAGSWMELTTPEIPAGRYELILAWKGHDSRGVAGFRVDGQDLDLSLDQYAAGESHTTTSLGSFSFDGSGPHAIRVRVTGKNDQSSGFLLSADKLTFARR